MEFEIFEGHWNSDTPSDYIDTHIFVFGDNMARQGYRGQACVRDNVNAHGIATKTYPCNNTGCYFSDTYYKEYTDIIKYDIDSIIWLAGQFDKTIVLSEFGYGHGMAKLPEKAPKIYEFLNQYLLERMKFDNKKGELV